MSDFKISDLVEQTEVASTDELILDTGGGSYKKITAEDAGLYPLEVAISLSGATTIDLSTYSRNANFILTLTANSTIVFSNMVSGQTGYLSIVQDGSSAYTLSYSGTDFGDDISEPGIGEVDVVSFVITGIDTAGAAAPVFGIKTDVKA